MRNSNYGAFGHLVPEDLLDAEGGLEIDGCCCLFLPRAKSTFVLAACSIQIIHHRLHHGFIGSGWKGGR
jgi:hypothetical protein